MKILLIADLHLGATLTGFSVGGAKRIRDYMWQALSALPTLVKQQTVDMVIIAGDLFDQRQIDPNWFYRVNHIFQRLIDLSCVVVYATGNHDYFIDHHYFGGLANAAEFILFCEERVETRRIEVASKSVAVHGIGYKQRQPARSVASEFSKAANVDYNIGVLHGVVGKTVNSAQTAYYTADLNSLNQLHYDLFALGHIHRFVALTDRIYYPGNMLPVSCNDMGHQMGQLITLTDHGANISAISFGNWQIDQLTIHAHGEHIQAVIQGVISQITRQTSTCDLAYINIVVNPHFSWQMQHQLELNSALKQVLNPAFSWQISVETNFCSAELTNDYLDTLIAQACRDVYEQPGQITTPFLATDSTSVFERLSPQIVSNMVRHAFYTER